MVVVRDTDRYGRLVGDVYVGSNHLNQELVEAGLAWWYREYAAGDAVLEDLEKQARAADAGLWAEDNAVAPWDWRRGERNPVSSTPAAGRASSPPATSIDAAAPSGQIVYVTRTGTKYHRDGCRHLSKSRIEMDLAEAARRYGPCSVCGPPTVKAAAAPLPAHRGVTPPRTQTAPPPGTQAAPAARRTSSVQCTGTTKKGARCKRMTLSANGRCYQHGGS